jgi:hypothetical protein
LRRFRSPTLTGPPAAFPIEFASLGILEGHPIAAVWAVTPSFEVVYRRFCKKR